MECLLCKATAQRTLGYGRVFHQCPDCGFLFTLDYNADALAKGMGMEGSWTGPGGGGHREYCLVKILRELFHMETFLLFGTGNTKTLALLLAEGLDVVGCDISRDVVAHKKALHGNDRFYRPDALPRGRRFDGIVAVEVIEHFTQPEVSFGLLFDHLAVGGIIAGTTNFHPGGPIEDSNTPGYMSHQGHVAYWSLSSLQRLASGYGKAVTAFAMTRPGSLLPDERFGQLWPNKRVFFIHDTAGQARALGELRADNDILDITSP